ncbi:uncharacterized protein LOC135488262 isoform X2 [Lineus longissimus]|uniref:uncharacterized protein LOC135488262 isoform X2 n=1 Tax=Lineus longissimus TaxID=88925 RepID=UPI00315DAA81
MADNEDVPPLEDMSELLQQVEALREHKPSSVSKTTIPEKKIPQSVSENGDTNITSTPPGVGKESKEPVKKATGVSQPSTFGGFKKGFLFGSSNSKPSSQTSAAARTTSKEPSKKVEEIPYIKPKDSQAKEKQNQMPEVQEAMKASQSLLDNKDWVTDDLLERVEKSPNLMKYLADPRFSQALAEFQTNPQGAQLKYADNPEVQLFFKDFCGLLGDHFSKIGTTRPNATSTNNQGDIKFTQRPRADIQEHNPNAPTPIEEKRMQEILSRPDVREVLMDPQVQSLFEQLKTNPSDAQKLLQTKDPALHRKISKLVDAGLLTFQM